MPKDDKFFSGRQTPHLQRLQQSDEDEDQCWEGNLNDTTQRLFKEMDFVRQVTMA